jgi:hypothetical protein
MWDIVYPKVPLQQGDRVDSGTLVYQNDVLAVTMHLGTREVDYAG